ncbi:hypothetical protein ABZ804_22470 [Streptomyces sp. NPDC047726]|uniref:hypothetical protein n=1 Tax=unclassified Streptomyces TaxID=2593676 RepID=UPI0033EF0780
MSAALAVKSLAELGEAYGPMRVVLSSETGTDVVPEQAEAYALNVLGGKGLGESIINGSDGGADLVIRFVRYIDPVTQKERFGVDYWSIDRYFTLDHAYRCMAEAAYEAVVLGEFAHPSLALDRDRFSRGLIGFYDVTDVV